MKKEILNSTILLWILGSIDILLVISAILLDGRFPKYLFGAENPKANGDFLTICFSIIGGGAVIYGLYLNNKRIGEQTRQNDIARRQADIAASNNNDKRFGDAIGYLNSDNVGIAIGGAYALYQLAKEDERYVPIVANIFSEYLSMNPDGSYNPVEVNNLIVRLMLSTNNKVFSSEKLKFHHTNFNMSTEIQGINNIEFEDCKLHFVYFNGINELSFQRCMLNECSIIESTNLNIFNGEVSDVEIENSINRLEVVNLRPSKMGKCNVIASRGILDFRFCCYDVCYLLTIDSRCIKKLILNVSKSKSSTKNTSKRIIVKTFNKENVHIRGNSELVEIINSELV